MEVDKSMEVAFEWLLKAMWIAGTVPILLAMIPFPGSTFVRPILAVLANRGKTVSSSTKRLLVPQSYFLHFYVVGVLWTTFLLICLLCYAIGEDVSLQSSEDKIQLSETEDLMGMWKTIFMLMLMEIQVLRRLYESIFVFHYNKSAKMHIMAYLTGLYFYTAAPMSIFRSASPAAWHYIGSFPDAVGKCSGLRLSGHVKPLTELGWYQWIGGAIWLWGSVHQYRCHSILGSARKHDGAEKYVIAKGDWFELVSCPHYLAEIVIYAGILVSSGGFDLTMWLLFAFVVVNLAFAATEAHEWYHHKFDNYPSSRRAIFPLIF